MTTKPAKENNPSISCIATGKGFITSIATNEPAEAMTCYLGITLGIVAKLREQGVPNKIIKGLLLSAVDTVTSIIDDADPDVNTLLH